LAGPFQPGLLAKEELIAFDWLVINASRQMSSFATVFMPNNSLSVDYPDTSLDKIDFRDFDGLVLPGGSPGFINLGNDERILTAAREMDKAGKYVAAICAAPSVLIKAGVLQGRNATVSPSGKAQVAACAHFSDDRVVVDKNLITSRSPGTALEFALRLVEVFVGREKMLEIKAQTLAHCAGD
jgi:protein deglycase